MPELNFIVKLYRVDAERPEDYRSEDIRLTQFGVIVPGADQGHSWLIPWARISQLGATDAGMSELVPEPRGYQH